MWILSRVAVHKQLRMCTDFNNEIHNKELLKKSIVNHIAYHVKKSKNMESILDLDIYEFFCYYQSEWVIGPFGGTQRPIPGYNQQGEAFLT